MQILINMGRLIFIFSLLFACTACAQWQFQNWKREPRPAPEPKVVAVSVIIDLSDQRAYLLMDGRVVYQSKVSTGRKGNRTPTGSFKITQKTVHHRSTLYGQFVDEATGEVMKDNVDSRLEVAPSGQRYLGYRMTHFMRFNGAIGMHEGVVPDYPASRGCVRLPAKAAATFFKYCPKGTPVTVRQ